jgi:GT2 family glycosyltransferase
VKSEDPEGLVTYVNYPTTEYLQLFFLDLVCFNVYLESKEKFRSYLTRLQNIAGERPLIMTEIGLDSLRNGEDAQAYSLDWQVRKSFASGCAGAFVYAWTDEWYRGGNDIKDWDFGLTDRDRHPKKALFSVSNAFDEVPYSKNIKWPKISVILCSHNGSLTIRETLEGLEQLEYPDYEVIVVNDGSTDDTAAIASEFAFSLINTENLGLSHARNTGYKASIGKIVAYIDDDAYPDPHWLYYLAFMFLTTSYVGIGGSNVAPSGEGFVANCIARSPGGPVHILISDQEAEHIPGCNMAFRKEALESIGGFDPQFRVAGDDVDICWRLQQMGWKIGFTPAALVWHRRRNSIKAYWKQQVGYGKAEALLEKKWPGKYNSVGHPNWKGKIYASGLQQALLFRRWRIYYGVWGSAPFQSLYERSPGTIMSLPLLPEWYQAIVFLGALSLMGILWRPLFLALPLLVIAASAPVAQALLCTMRAIFPTKPRSTFELIKLRTLTAFLHLLQPFARLTGRFNHGLTPLRRRGKSSYARPLPRISKVWSERWQEFEKRMSAIESELRSQGAAIKRSGDYDCWDLEIRGGLFGSIQLRGSVEDHAGGKQMILIRSWPKILPRALIAILLFLVIAFFAFLDEAWLASGILGFIALLFAVRTFGDCASATATYLSAIDKIKEEEKKFYDTRQAI